jgi:hypothetical protein
MWTDHGYGSGVMNVGMGRGAGLMSGPFRHAALPNRAGQLSRHGVAALTLERVQQTV